MSAIGLQKYLKMEILEGGNQLRRGRNRPTD